jgi:hypothetical protein
MSDEIILKCWILGDDLDDVFPVELQKSRTVGEPPVKDMVKIGSRLDQGQEPACVPTC